MKRNQAKSFRKLLLLASSLSLPAFPQGYDRIAPKPPVVSSPKDVTSGSAPVKERKATEVVVPDLKGLVFVGDLKAIQQATSHGPGVSVVGLDMLKGPAFQGAASSYLGKPLTFGDLNQITRLVVGFYRAHHHPVVDVLVPEQDVSSGIVEILVTEFRVGKVVAKGNKWFSDQQVTAPLKLDRGDTIDSLKLLSNLDAANSNPFRQVNLLYEPSADAGYTDLVLETTDRFPLRAYTGFDNSGQPATGRSLWSLGLDWGNALWRDEQLSYQFTSSTDFFTGRNTSTPGTAGAGFESHALNWTMPLRGSDSLTVFGAYEQSSPNLGQDLGLVGKSGQASIRYSLSLPRTEHFVQGLQVGYDFKTTNNNLDFGGTQVSANVTEIDQFPVAYTARYADAWGSTAATSTLVYSPGGITPNNTNSAFQPAAGQSGRPFADANYTYFRTDLSRLTKLPKGAVWSLRAIAQASDRTLLDTERISVGGPDILRGYNPYSLLGDEGVAFSNELRTPTFGKPNGDGLLSNLPGRLQFLGFWDFARLHNRMAVDGEPESVNASSIGIGTRYNFRTNVSLKLDYGWQLEHIPGTDGRNQLASIGIVVGN